MASFVAAQQKGRNWVMRTRHWSMATSQRQAPECRQSSAAKHQRRKKPAELASDGFCQRLMQRPYYLATQLLTNFRPANHPSFWSFACFVHSAVFSFMAALSAADIFAASAGAGMNAVPLTSTAIMPANNAVTKRDMMRSP